MRRAVVTGGAGFVGRHLVKRLLDRGEEVTVFDQASRGIDGPPARTRPRHVTGDIRDHARLAEAIRPGVDVVYHLAAVVGVDRYLSRPLDVIDINFAGTRNVLELSASHGAKVVVASTSEVFGKNPTVPWAEDSDRVLGSTTAERWTYSSSKALTEHMTFAFVRQRGLRATVVRYFNVYGPAQRPAYVVSRNVHRALNGRLLLVYDRGVQTRCFTYVDDAVEATVLAADSPRALGEAFNIGSTAETTVADVVALIAELTGGTTAPAPVDTAAVLGPAYEDLLRRVPDTSKARALLGWKSVTELREGLIKTIEWARVNPWWLALGDSGAAQAPA